MANIGGDTGCTTDIVEAQGSDVLVKLQEQGKRLADSSSGAENGNLVLTRSGRRETASLREGTSSRTGEHGGRRVGEWWEEVEDVCCSGQSVRETRCLCLYTRSEQFGRFLRASHPVQVLVVERNIGDNNSECDDAPADNLLELIRRYFLTTGNGRRASRLGACPPRLAWFRL